MSIAKLQRACARYVWPSVVVGYIARAFWTEQHQDMAKFAVWWGSCAFGAVGGEFASIFCALLFGVSVVVLLWRVSARFAYEDGEKAALQMVDRAIERFGGFEGCSAMERAVLLHAQAKINEAVFGKDGAPPT